MKYPIGIISFNRPHYLSELLKSLSKQSGDALKGREIHLFQDGGVLGMQQYANQADIEQCVEIFRATFPQGVVHISSENIGHIRNVLRMEEFFFVGQSSCAAAMFLEDDIVLSPHYVSAMDELIEHALSVCDVSYVRCIHNVHRSVDEQRLNRNKTFLVPGGQMWGYGLTREYWRKERATLASFYNMALTHPYRALDHNITQLQWWKLGAPITFHELDYAKDKASTHLGYAQISTYCVAAKYIGKEGVHFTPSIFEHQGWHALEMFEEPFSGFIFPDDHEKAVAISTFRQTNLDNQHIKLNLGIESECPPRSGWLNINGKYGFDLGATQLRDFSDNSVETIFSSHVLQKYQPQQCLALVRDIYRVLRFGGTVRLSGLSLRVLTEQMLYGDDRMETFLDSFWPQRDRAECARTYYLNLLGDISDLFSSPSPYGQITPLDFEQVAYMLIAGGFNPGRIRRCHFKSSSLAELRGEGFDSRPNHSYYVEAVK